MTEKIDADMQGINMVIPEEDSGLIGRLSIAFEAGDNLTTEKLSSALSLLNKNLNTDNELRLQVDKVTEDVAGDLTITAWEESKIDGSNARYSKVIDALVVEKIAGARTVRSFNLSGLGYGTGNIKFGASFATDSGAITVYLSLYRK